MQLPSAFDPTKTAPSTGGGGQLPISDQKGHVVVITDAEMKATRDNTGQYLQFEITVTEGPHAGATGAIRLNIANQSQEAVQIAYRDWSAICHVIGWLQPVHETEVLYNKPFRVVVGYQKGQEDKGYTEVKQFLDINGNKPGEQNKGAAPQTVSSPAPAAPAPAAPAPAAPAPQQSSGFPAPPQPQQAPPAPQQQPPQPQQQFPVQNVPQQPPQPQPAPQQQYAPQPGQAPAAPQMPPWVQG